MSERLRVLKAIRKCLSDAHSSFQEAMDVLDEMGRGSVGVGMTPLVGGFAMKDPKSGYRTALISLDCAEKALQPLAVRLRDGRVNATHFREERAMSLLGDLINFDYDVLISMLSERRGRESVWYRLSELSKIAEQAYQLVLTE